MSMKTHLQFTPEPAIHKTRRYGSVSKVARHTGVQDHFCGGANTRICLPTLTGQETEWHLDRRHALQHQCKDFMISDTEIAEALKSGAIEIRYSVLFPGDGTAKFIEDARSAMPKHKPEWERFQQLLFRNKLGICCGTLVLPHRRKPIPKELQFDGQKHIVDLRKCSDGWTIRPGETLVVTTAEWFKMGKDHSAMILSRVTNYEVGIFVHSSYIDSLWEGILKLSVTNTSSVSRCIRLGDEIARAFFFKVGAGSTEDRSNFEHASHYNRSWKALVRDRMDPFAHMSDLASEKDSRKQRLLKYLKNAGLVLSAGALIACGKKALDFYAAALEIFKRTSQIEAADVGVKKLRESVPLHGEFSSVLKQGDSLSTRRIPLDRAVGSTPFVVIERTTGPTWVSVTNRLESQGSQSQLVLDIRAQEEVKTNTIVGFKWLLIP